MTTLSLIAVALAVAGMLAFYWDARRNRDCLALVKALLPGPAYGLQLQARTGMGERVYRLLRAMKEDGLLESYDVTDGGRPRRFYRLRCGEENR